MERTNARTLPCTICGEVGEVGLTTEARYCSTCVTTGRYLNYKQTGQTTALIGLEGDDKSMTESKDVQEQVAVKIEERRARLQEEQAVRARPVLKDVNGKRRGDYINEFLLAGKTPVETVDLVLELFPGQDRDKLYRYIFTYHYKLRKDGLVPKTPPKKPSHPAI